MGTVVVCGEEGRGWTVVFVCSSVVLETAAVQYCHPIGAAWTKRTVEETSKSQDEMRGGNNNLVTFQSVSFFYYYYYFTDSFWRGSVNPYSGRKLCMWPAFHLFLIWWIICHLDSVGCLQSGAARQWIGDEFDINCIYSESKSEWDSQWCHRKEKNTFVSTTCLQNTSFFLKKTNKIVMSILSLIIHKFTLIKSIFVERYN